MENKKVQQLVNTLSEKTVRGEFIWKSLSDFPDGHMERISRKINVPIIMSESFWLETKTQFLYLIAQPYSNFNIIIFAKDDEQLALFEVTPTSYYRLKALINDQFYNQNKLIDDFLNHF